MGAWMREIKGIGPVLSAGLLAHIDITKAAHVGHIYSFAGLAPGKVWKKGQKRPWNADLRKLCWLVGESFVKVSGKEDALYGRLYAEKKLQLVEQNEAGEFKEAAEHVLETKNIGKTTDAYKAYIKGKLPKAHVHARARRWTVKIFLAHLHQRWYEQHFNKPAPEPFPFAHLGHADKIEPPPFPE